MSLSIIRRGFDREGGAGEDEMEEGGIEKSGARRACISAASWGLSTPAAPIQMAAKRGSEVGREMRPWVVDGAAAVNVTAAS